MTVVGSDLDPTTVTTHAPGAGRRDPLEALPAWARLSSYAAILVLILTIAEQATNQTRLTSSNTWASALNLSVPIALAGLGGLWSERAGIVNIGLEGMMILGTWMGAWGCIEYGPWAGVALGVLGGALGGLLHGIATVGFGVDHIVSGVAINILGLGVTQFANLEIFDSTNQSPRIPDNVAEVSVPGINDVLGDITGHLTDASVLIWMAVSVVVMVAIGVLLSPRRGRDGSGPFGLTPTTASRLRTAGITVFGLVAFLCLVEVAPYLDDQQRFFISELGRIVVGLTQDLSLIVVLAIVAFPVSAFVLWRTKFGLRLRSVGEDPLAAESLGVNVYLMKYVGVIMSGALAGLGGVALVYVFAGQYRVGQTNGRGYIGLAAMIFGNWLPAGLAMGAGLFGFTDSLSLQSGETTRSLLVVVGLLAALLGLRGLITGKWRAAIVALIAAGVSFFYYTIIEEIPGEIVTFLPHLTTLLVLTFASQRLRPPAADGQPYRRGGSG